MSRSAPGAIRHNPGEEIRGNNGLTTRTIDRKEQREQMCTGKQAGKLSDGKRKIGAGEQIKKPKTGTVVN
eukprot:scaffold10199_cov146-Cylindrotheca_fusiformis.AAC.34